MKRGSKRERRGLILLFSAIGIVSLIIFAVLLLNDGSGRSGDLSSDGTVAQGRQIYTVNCAACHGVDLEG